MSWNESYQPPGPIPGSGGQPESWDPYSQQPQQPQYEQQPYPQEYPQGYPQGNPQAPYPPHYQSEPQYQAPPEHYPHQQPQYEPEPQYQASPQYQADTQYLHQAPTQYQPDPQYGTYPQYQADPQFGGYPPPQPPKSGRKVNRGVVITSVVTVLVLGVGCAVLLSNGQNNPTTTSQGTGPDAIVQSILTADGNGSAQAATPTAPDTAGAPTATPPASSGSGSGSGAVSLPASANGLYLLTSKVGTSEATTVRNGVATGGAIYTNVLVGSYGPTPTGNYRLVLVDQPLANMDSADQSELEATTPTAFVAEFTSELKMSDSKVETSTDPKAALTCGYYVPTGTKIEVCVWDDAAGFGYAYFLTNYYTTSIANAAKDTDALRAAAEGS